MTPLTCLTLSSSSSRCWLCWFSDSIMLFSSVHLSSSESCSDRAATLHTRNSFSRSLIITSQTHWGPIQKYGKQDGLKKYLFWAHHLSLCRSLMSFWVTLRSFWRIAVSLYNTIKITPGASFIMIIYVNVTYRNPLLHSIMWNVAGTLPEECQSPLSAGL